MTSLNTGVKGKPEQIATDLVISFDGWFFILELKGTSVVLSPSEAGALTGYIEAVAMTVAVKEEKNDPA